VALAAIRRSRYDASLYLDRAKCARKSLWQSGPTGSLPKGSGSFTTAV